MLDPEGHGLEWMQAGPSPAPSVAPGRIRTWKELDTKQVPCTNPPNPPPTNTNPHRVAGREGGPEALGPKQGCGLARRSPLARVGSSADVPPMLSPPLGEGYGVLSLGHTPFVHTDIRPAPSLRRQARVPRLVLSLLSQLQMGAPELPATPLSPRLQG